MKLSYEEQLERKIKKHQHLATRFAEVGLDDDARDNRLAVLYYSERLGGVACASWETFKRSWAGKQWVAQKSVLEKAGA